ncbi:tyrosine-type recombinase/integrase [Paraliomyxa miuraensis]|uniref:tyrosine-type recombinase/integrase n=1 Tax=Paraliomyxa miuraensis TaxID=376150 RepID=UPI002253296F|nr:site-specific integrase [Paraliomyxa miuraensis]MCX4239497.1 site-specific integrase [Paraliomyxa miuraensis]
MTIRKTQRGRWMIDVKIRMPDGSLTRIRKVSPVPTKRGAEQLEREVRGALAAGTYGSKEDEEEVPTFKEFAGYFIETYATTNNRPSTVREKRRTLGRGLLEHLGRLRLHQITARHVETFKARRKKDGVGPKTINEELAILSKILGYAGEIGELTKAPPKIRRLKVPKPAFDFLDFKEGKRLIKAARRAPEPWCAMIPTAMWTGLRLGELRALRWEDVDLVAARLHVRQAADDENELHPPKSGQPRIVDLPKKAVAVLRDQQQHQRGDYVFSREDGSMLTRWDCEPKSKDAKHDSPITTVSRKAGLRRVGWHMLRHTYASHLVMSGANLLEVKELLGHASLEMTMRYAHLSPSARRKAVELLDGADGAPEGQHGGIAEDP